MWHVGSGFLDWSHKAVTLVAVDGCRCDRVIASEADVAGREQP